MHIQKAWHWAKGPCNGKHKEQKGKQKVLILGERVSSACACPWKPWLEDVWVEAPLGDPRSALQQHTVELHLLRIVDKLATPPQEGVSSYCCWSSACKAIHQCSAIEDHTNTISSAESNVQTLLVCWWTLKKFSYEFFSLGSTCYVYCDSPQPCSLWQEVATSLTELQLQPSSSGASSQKALAALDRSGSAIL